MVKRKSNRIIDLVPNPLEENSKKSRISLLVSETSALSISPECSNPPFSHEGFYTYSASEKKHLFHRPSTLKERNGSSVDMVKEEDLDDFLRETVETDSTFLNDEPEQQQVVIRAKDNIINKAKNNDDKSLEKIVRVPFSFGTVDDVLFSEVKEYQGHVKAYLSRIQVEEIQEMSILELPRPTLSLASERFNIDALHHTFLAVVTKDALKYYILLKNICSHPHSFPYYLTGFKGIGKSFSMAISTVLLRLSGFKVVFMSAYLSVRSLSSVLTRLLLELAGQFYEYDDIFTLIRSFVKECTPATLAAERFFGSFFETFLSLLKEKNLSRNILFIFDQLNDILSDTSSLEERDKNTITRFFSDLSQEFNCVFVWSANNQNVNFPLSPTWKALEKSIRSSKDELKVFLSFYSDALKEPIDLFDEQTFKIIDYYTSCIPYFLDLFLSTRGPGDTALSLREKAMQFHVEFSSLYSMQKTRYIKLYLKSDPKKMDELNQNLAYSIFLKGCFITKSKINIIIDGKFFEIQGTLNRYTLMASTPFIEYIEWKNYIDHPSLLHLKETELAEKIENSLSFLAGSGKGQLFERVFISLLLSSPSLSFQIHVDDQAIDVGLCDIHHRSFSNLSEIRFLSDSIYYPSLLNYPLVDMFMFDQKNKRLLGIQVTLDVEGHFRNDMNLSHKRLDTYQAIVALCEKNGFESYLVYASTSKQFSDLGKNQPRLNCFILDEWRSNQKLFSLF